MLTRRRLRAASVLPQVLGHEQMSAFREWLRALGYSGWIVMVLLYVVLDLSIYGALTMKVPTFFFTYG